MRRWLTGLFVALTTLAWAGASRNPDSPYGVCAHLARGDEFRTQTGEFGLMLQAGVAWARSDFDWSGVQPDPDTWKFEHLDTVLSNAENAGVQLLPILDYSVSFADPAHQNLDLWGKYVRALVERYQTRLPVWEVWNEQNLDGFWKNANPDDYLTLLKKTYETVKAVDPKLMVAVGGFAGVPTNFIDRLYQAGGAKYFDVMNVHPYGHPFEPESYLEDQLAGLKETMAKYGDAAKPVWITGTFDRTEALRAMLPNTFSVAAKQYRSLLKRLEGMQDKFPHRWENGALVTVDPKEWTSGFFPGSLWYLYEYTQAPEWKEAALRYTAMLEQVRHYTGNHDIGFMLYCSYGNGLRLANPEGYKEVLLDGAAALCTRFVPRLGMIRSWDSYNNPVIIDNMMNLELLMWAAKQSGDKRFSEIAVSHADQTNRRHFRPDNSAYHIVDYNPLNYADYYFLEGLLRFKRLAN